MCTCSRSEYSPETKKNEHLGERELDCKLQKPWCLVQKLSLFSEKFWRKFYLAPRSYFLVVYTDL